MRSHHPAIQTVAAKHIEVIIEQNMAVSVPSHLINPIQDLGLPLNTRDNGSSLSTQKVENTPKNTLMMLFYIFIKKNQVRLLLFFDALKKSLA